MAEGSPSSVPRGKRRRKFKQIQTSWTAVPSPLTHLNVKTVQWRDTSRTATCVFSVQEFHETSPASSICCLPKRESRVKNTASVAPGIPVHNHFQIQNENMDTGSGPLPIIASPTMDVNFREKSRGSAVASCNTTTSASSVVFPALITPGGSPVETVSPAMSSTVVKLGKNVKPVKHLASVRHFPEVMQSQQQTEPEKCRSSEHSKLFRDVDLHSYLNSLLDGPSTKNDAEKVTSKVPDSRVFGEKPHSNLISQAFANATSFWDSAFPQNSSSNPQGNHHRLRSPITLPAAACEMHSSSSRSCPVDSPASPSFTVDDGVPATSTSFIKRRKTTTKANVYVPNLALPSPTVSNGSGAAVSPMSKPASTAIPQGTLLHTPSPSMAFSRSPLNTGSSSSIEPSPHSDFLLSDSNSVSVGIHHFEEATSKNADPMSDHQTVDEANGFVEQPLAMESSPTKPRRSCRRSKQTNRQFWLLPPRIQQAVDFFPPRKTARIQKPKGSQDCQFPFLLQALSLRKKDGIDYRIVAWQPSLMPKKSNRSVPTCSLQSICIEAM